VRNAALAFVLGVDGRELLTAPDPADRLMWTAVVKRATEHRRQEMQAQAILIAAEVARLFRK
jgi:hypothetical protein